MGYTHRMDLSFGRSAWSYLIQYSEQRVMCSSSTTLLLICCVNIWMHSFSGFNSFPCFLASCHLMDSFNNCFFASCHLERSFDNCSLIRGDDLGVASTSMLSCKLPCSLQCPVLVLLAW